MSVAVEKDLYEQFEPKEDTLYFRIGEQDVICFHGSNCHIRKRISGEQRTDLMTDSAFVRVSSDCYVNVKRVSGVEDDCLYFEEKSYGDKRMPVSRRIREEVQRRLEEQRKLAN